MKKTLQFTKQSAIISSVERQKQEIGVDYVEGTPVPIPNTEVKLNGAEDTWVVTPRENREMPISYE